MVDEQAVADEWASSQRWRWQFIVAASLIATVLLCLGLAHAQDANRAGLVIQFGDGSVQTACVNLALADRNGMVQPQAKKSCAPPICQSSARRLALGQRFVRLATTAATFPKRTAFANAHSRRGRIVGIGPTAIWKAISGYSQGWDQVASPCAQAMWKAGCGASARSTRALNRLCVPLMRSARCKRRQKRRLPHSRPRRASR